MSRGNGSVVAIHGSENGQVSKEQFRELLQFVETKLKEGRDNDKIPSQVLAPDNIAERSRKRPLVVQTLTALPLNSKYTEADLYLIIKGTVDSDTLDYVRVLIHSALLSLNNAGQYQALVYEAEKRQQLVKELGTTLEFKSQFVANISHELRTPIYSFIGFGELLLDDGYGELSSEQRAVINRMVENSKNLLELINNILDLSKLDADKLKPRLTDGLLSEFMPEIVETCAALLRDKPVSLHLIIAEDMPRIRTDWTMLRQIAMNLISNALKFTEKGRVEILVSLDIPNPQILLKVRDTGIGIPPERFAEIFEPFRQLESAYTKRYAGTGLGLAITKKQILALGGTIEVTSNVGEGSEFSVVIPVLIGGSQQAPEFQSLPSAEVST